MIPGPLHLPPEVCREVGEILGLVGDKWSILVVRCLQAGPVRFNGLRRDIGSITQKMLTATLRSLERDGYVARTVTPSVPQRVDYELTPLGHDLLVPLDALANWALARRAQVAEARRAFDAVGTESKES